MAGERARAGAEGRPDATRIDPSATKAHTRPATTGTDQTQDPFSLASGPQARDAPPRQIGSAAPLLALQRTAGNRAVSALVQRDKVSDLEARTKVLEKKADATNLDAKYRAEFGKKTSNYKQIVYRLTGAFQAATSGFTTAQSQQAAQDAIIDQVVTTLILVGGAAALEPFLMASLGRLKGALSGASAKIAKIDVKGVVEKLENPINAAASGTGNVATTSRSGDRAAGGQAPAGAGPAVPGKGGDPLTFLSGNLEAIEAHTQAFEQAFSERADKFATMTPEQWDTWDRAAQEAKYLQLLADLDKLALGDVAKLEESNTLAVKIELYLWAAWIKSHVPGVSGLQIGSKLASRLKTLGVESLAGVQFDTSSWIFMDHKPTGTWEANLRNWANTWSQKITK